MTIKFRNGVAVEVGARYKFDPSAGNLFHPERYEPGEIELTNVNVSPGGTIQITYKIIYGVKKKDCDDGFTFSIGSNFESCITDRIDDTWTDELLTDNLLEDFLNGFHRRVV